MVELLSMGIREPWGVLWFGFNRGYWAMEMCTNRKVKGNTTKVECGTQSTCLVNRTLDKGLTHFSDDRRRIIFIMSDWK